MPLIITFACRLLSVLTLAAIALNPPALAAELFVSPAGDDSNPGTQARPFASVERAQMAARFARSTSPGSSVIVTFGPGVYEMQRSLEFTPLDSGISAEQPTVYRAQPGAEVIISGGRRVTGWQADSQRPGIWKTRIQRTGDQAAGEWRFEQLWVNGARATRARTPNAWDFSILKGVAEEPSGDRRRPYRHTFTVKPEDAAALRGLPAEELQDVQILVFHKWDTTRERLREAAPADGRLVSDGAVMKWWNQMQRGGLYLLENFLGALDSPGEWFLDREGWLYYQPRPGEDLSNAEVIAPMLEHLVSIQGAPEMQVQHLRFEGLKFRHAELRIPPEGYAPNQAAMNVTAAAIALDHARGIQFTHCAVEHIGGTAIWFRRNTQDCAVEHSRVFDVGVSGVRIGETGIVPSDVRTSGITVDNCIIQSGGRIRPDAVGIWIGHSADNVIRHCDVGDFFYTAISAGWRWGYGENGAKRNLIEFNHLHHIGYGILSDMAGVYTLGKSEGTVVRNNVIHDVYAGSYGGWGLYCDEGSSHILFENNLVYDVLDGGMHQHYGRENVFRNNILAFSRETQMAVTRAEPHLSFTFERNVVYWDQGELLAYGGWKGAKVQSRTNLYWRPAGQKIDFDGKTWDQWREQGNDAGSIITDPLFVDAARRDFRLRADSPASRIGFQPFDPRRAGVYGSTAWKNLAADRTWPPAFVTPTPDPVQLHDDFEDRTASPLLNVASLNQGKRSDLIVITNDPADPGNHCLRFEDAPGLDRDFYPFLNWNPHYSSGVAKLKFAIRLETDAQAKCEWRYGSRGIVGPSVDFRGGGVWVRGRQLLSVPADTWFQVEMRATLGEPEPRWDLIATLPGAAPREFKGLTCDSRWAGVGWVGFISTATQRTMFHLDNIKMENPGAVQCSMLRSHSMAD
ncbi:MAG TPA: right-handed parallel beta-helix repeat-containing protein [Verrucomicrobiae bacterium]|nr:right-handed parallel beta-helix repeat-containing protein [Verrucomicrobiae bacterium]